MKDEREKDPLAPEEAPPESSSPPRRRKKNKAARRAAQKLREEEEKLKEAESTSKGKLEEKTKGEKEEKICKKLGKMAIDDKKKEATGGDKKIEKTEEVIEGAAEARPVQAERKPKTPGEVEKVVIEDAVQSEGESEGEAAALIEEEMCSAWRFVTDFPDETEYQMEDEPMEMKIMTYCELLVKEGIDLDERNLGDGPEPVLVVAIYHRHLEAVKYLLSHGADPNIRNADDITALMLATKANEPEIVKALLNAGASVDARSDMEDFVLNF